MQLLLTYGASPIRVCHTPGEVIQIISNIVRGGGDVNRAIAVLRNVSMYDLSDADPEVDVSRVLYNYRSAYPRRDLTNLIIGNSYTYQRIRVSEHVRITSRRSNYFGKAGYVVGRFTSNNKNFVKVRFYSRSQILQNTMSPLGEVRNYAESSVYSLGEFPLYRKLRSFCMFPQEAVEERLTRLFEESNLTTSVFEELAEASTVPQDMFPEESLLDTELSDRPET